LYRSKLIARRVEFQQGIVRADSLNTRNKPTKILSLVLLVKRQWVNFGDEVVLQPHYFDALWDIRQEDLPYDRAVPAVEHFVRVVPITA
jgi:hypothetical protein